MFSLFQCLMVMDLPARLNAAGGMGGLMDPNRKSRKKRKDPNAPKRATNAYMIFCKERRAALKEERPDLAFGKLGATLGEMWRKMTPEEKKPYESRASGDRDRYKSEMGSYQSANMLKGNAMQQLGMSHEEVQSVLNGHANPNKKMKLDETGAAQYGMADLSAGQIDPSQLDMTQYYAQLQQQQQLAAMQQQLQQQQVMQQQQQQLQQQAAGMQPGQTTVQMQQPVGVVPSAVQPQATFDTTASKSTPGAAGEGEGGEQGE